MPTKYTSQGTLFKLTLHHSWVSVGGSKSHDPYRFQKALLSKCFPFNVKLKAGVFKFLQLEERF